MWSANLSHSTFRRFFKNGPQNTAIWPKFHYSGAPEVLFLFAVDTQLEPFLPAQLHDDLPDAKI